MYTVIIGAAFFIMLAGSLLLLFLSSAPKRKKKIQDNRASIKNDNEHENFDNFLLGQSLAKSTKNNTQLNTTGLSSSMMDMKACPVCVATNRREEQTCKNCGYQFEE